jgi:hypothetical protein
MRRLLSGLLVLCALVACAAVLLARREPTVTPGPVRAEIARLTVAEETTMAGYHRATFGGWIDADHDGCDTRCEVLRAERLAKLPGLSHGGWLSTYDGYTTDDSSELDVDHVVAIGEAWKSGARSWDERRRHAFANDLGDPRALAAVTAATNRSKGDRDPASWQPPNREAWCGFVDAWVSTKLRWSLTADRAEITALTNMSADCPQT